jgi:hypothetical protein
MPARITAIVVIETPDDLLNELKLPGERNMGAMMSTTPMKPITSIRREPNRDIVH